MIRIILYSINEDIRKTVIDLTKKRGDYDLVIGDFDLDTSIDIDPSNINLIIFDLSGLSIDDKKVKTDLKKLNELFSKSKAGRMLILEPGQQNHLFEDLLFTNDFLFVQNLNEELISRIDFLLFKMKLMIPSNSIIVDDLILNLEKYELTVSGNIVVLTFKEFEMLKLLMQNKDKVFTRINLLSSVWGYDYYGGSRTVDVHMRRLRTKIPPPYNNMLKTIRNVGYMFSVER